MRLMSSAAMALVLLSPCFAIPGCDPAPLTRDTAIETAERVLAGYLSDDEPHSSRADFEAPVIQFGRDGALVGFRRRDTVSQGVTIVLGKNGCNSVSPGFHESRVERVK
jgi:hypothetical protein